MQFSYNWLQDFFDDTLPPAHDVAEQLGLHSFELEGIEKISGDYLIDWDVLPNRSSDCLCYEGIAREISTVFNVPYKSYLDSLTEITYDTSVLSSDMLECEIVTDLVPRATKRFAHDVVVGPSPEWLRAKLESIGQKSINNVVDITNYVMWMTGQPVHAFDYDKLSGDDNKKYMSIRHATDGEQVTDLTGASFTLDSSMLVVADRDKALDIAGIKGGSNSGVDDSTTRIVLSACNYDYKNIRHTSRTLKLQTDASKRYENEVPHIKADRAMMLLADLITRECSGIVSNDIIDIDSETHDTIEIPCSVNRINSLLGISMESTEITAILDRLFITWRQGSNTDELIVTPSAERLDLRIPEDVAEEIGRIYGLYNIPETPIAGGFTTPKKNILKQSWYRVGDTLANLGFFEVYNRSLVSGGSVRLANSLNANADSLRASLIHELTEKTEKNFVHTDTPRLFEIGKVFTGVTNGTVDEHWSFAGVIGYKKIKDKQRNDIFLQTKGILETVFENLSIPGVVWVPGSDDVIAHIQLDESVIGSVGVNWWEINFEDLISGIDTTVRYQRPSRYPKIDRDVAVFVPMDTTVGNVMSLMHGVTLEQCTGIQLFDVFEDTENGRKSLGFRFVFQSDTETLSDEFANAQMDKIYTVLGNQPNFEIR